MVGCYHKFGHKRFKKTFGDLFLTQSKYVRVLLEVVDDSKNKGSNGQKKMFDKDSFYKY